MTATYLSQLPISDLADLADLPDLRIESAGDHSGDNNARAAFAAAAITAYVARVGGEDIEISITDLLADLRHLCDSARVDFERAIDRSGRHHLAELRGEL